MGEIVPLAGRTKAPVRSPNPPSPKPKAYDPKFAQEGDVVPFRRQAVALAICKANHVDGWHYLSRVRPDVAAKYVDYDLARDAALVTAEILAHIEDIVGTEATINWLLGGLAKADELAATQPPRRD